MPNFWPHHRGLHWLILALCVYVGVNVAVL